MDAATLQQFYNNVIRPLLLETIPQILGGIIGALAVLIVGNWVLQVIVKTAVNGARRSHVKPAQIDLLAASLTGAGWVFIASGVLSALHLNELSIAVGGSISLVALGIATAASGNLGDIIAGVFLASDPDFGIGFVIKTGEIEGTIERIDLRKTRLRTEDGKLHIVPNKSIESSVWIVERRPAEPAPAPKQHRPFPFIPGQRKPGEAPQSGPVQS